MLNAPTPMTEEELETYRLHRRFDRMGRLVGDVAMQKLMDSHVMVIGIGGVGSWAAESLARSGIGKLTLVDFDEICVTNFNRQLHSLQGLVGQRKAQVMGERIKKINPQCEVVVHDLFFNEHTQIDILDFTPGKRPDFLVDAIDHVTSKTFLIALCKREGLPMVCSTGSGGRMDPTRIKVADLGETEMDPLARSLRKVLREKYDFPSSGSFGVTAIYSDEPATPPYDLHYDGGKGFRCVCPQGQNEFFNCDNRNLIMGNASFVTGSFGFACASVAVKHLLTRCPATFGSEGESK